MAMRDSSSVPPAFRVPPSILHPILLSSLPDTSLSAISANMVCRKMLRALSGDPYGS